MIEKLIELIQSVIGGILAYRAGMKDEQLKQVKKQNKITAELKQKYSDVDRQKVSGSEVYDEANW